jgi:hypothetical protein
VGIDAATVTAILSALGLSGASGLNAWLPLLLVAVLGHTGLVDLNGSFAELERAPVILSLLALFLLDFAADKIPVVDHAMHAAGLVIHPVAGAALFDLQAGSDLPLIVTVLAGGSIAGTLHAARAAARPAVNVASGGVGAPVLSLLEDGASLLLAVGAILFPAVAGTLVVVLLIVAVLLARRARAAMRRRRAASITPRYAAHQRRGSNEPPKTRPR